MLKEKIRTIKYTLDHRKAFRKVEKQLLGRNTLRGYLHDLDKVFLKILLSERATHKLHVRYSKHHPKKARTKTDYVQMVIDWECARFTKPDKPLNARETLYRFHPELESVILPILEEFKL